MFGKILMGLQSSFDVFQSALMCFKVFRCVFDAFHCFLNVGFTSTSFKSLRKNQVFNTKVYVFMNILGRYF